MSNPPSRDPGNRNVETVANEQKAMQSKQDQKDAAGDKPRSKAPVQAGGPLRPAPPLNPADQSPEKIAEFGKDSDMHRPAQPDELSPAYVFLASSACSSYISGLVLPVTGNAGA